MATDDSHGDEDGLVIHLPSGKCVLDNTLTVPAGVSIRGAERGGRTRIKRASIADLDDLRELADNTEEGER